MQVLLSVEVDEALSEELRLLSEDTGRSVAELHQLALTEFLREDREHVDAVLEGLRDAKAGSVISHDEVRAWVESLKPAAIADEPRTKIPVHRAS